MDNSNTMMLSSVRTQTQALPHQHLTNQRAPGVGLAPQILPKTQAPIDKSSPLYKAAQDFEALFVKQMLDTMRKTVQKSGLNDGGHAEEIFEDMLYSEYAQQMTKSASFGLSDQLYRQMSYLQNLPKVENQLL